MTHFKPACMAVAGCLVVTHANAQTAGEWDIYGQLNLGVLSIDDGVDSNSYFTDNDNSNSRVGFWYSFPSTGTSQLKFNFETGLGLSGSAGVTPEKDELTSHYSRREIRKLEFIYTRDGAGQFSAGQGSMATDGAGEVDFSGTSIVQYPGVGDLGGATLFRFADGSQSVTRVGGAFRNLDGSRKFRVRYDTPSFGGFSFAAAYGQEVLVSGVDNDFYDVSGTYTNEDDVYKLTARLGYAWVDPGNENFVGSAGILHKPTGLNAAFAGGALQDGGEYFYLKAGIIRDLIAAGSTAFSVEYYTGDDFAFAGSEAEMIGLAVVQRIDRYNLEIYGSYRTHQLASATDAFRDIDLTMIGARWKF
jgi:hypothetical protein